MLTLYGIYNSRASRCLWLAEELGLAYRHVPVIQKNKLPDPLAEGAPLNTGSPAFLALSPAGFIPTLEDGDLVLFESLAISLYLARKQGGPLAPADAREEALMLQWSLFAATSIEPSALEITMTYRAGAETTPEGAARITAAKTRLARSLALLENHLQGAPYLVGGRFSVADINLAECLRYGEAEPSLYAESPALAAYMQKLQARPAYLSVAARRAAE